MERLRDKCLGEDTVSARREGKHFIKGLMKRWRARERERERFGDRSRRNRVCMYSNLCKTAGLNANFSGTVQSLRSVAPIRKQILSPEWRESNVSHNHIS